MKTSPLFRAAVPAAALAVLLAACSADGDDPPMATSTTAAQASAVDTATGEPCGRTGTLVVTAPNTTEQHLLAVNLPICDATISAVG